MLHLEWMVNVMLFIHAVTVMENGRNQKVFCIKKISRVSSNLTRNEPSGPEVVLKKKNGCLQSNKYTQTYTPILIRLNPHEVVRASKYI